MSVSKKETLNYIIMTAIILLFTFIPPIGSMSQDGMQLIGVFLAVVYGWLKIDLVSGSFYGILALMLTGIQPLFKTLMAGLSNQTVVIILVSMIFAGMVAKTDCIKIIVKYMMTSKIITKSPWVTILCLFVMCMLAAGIGMGYAAVFLMWAIALEITDSCGIKRNTPQVTFLISCITLVTVLTTFCFPWRAQVVQFTAIFTQAGFGVSYLAHMLYILFYVLLFVIGLILCGKYVLRLDFSNLKINDDMVNYYKEMKITNFQKAGLAAVVFFAVVMLIPSVITSTNWFVVFLSKFGIVGTIFVLLVIFSIFRDENGERLVKIEECHSAIQWNVIWLLLFALPFSTLLQTPDYGIMKTVLDAFMPLFSNMSPYLFIVLTMAIMGLVSQVLPNFALAAIFAPFLMAICTAIGGNAFVMFIAIVIAINCDASTPIGSTVGAVIYGNENISKKHFYLYGLMEMFICILVGALFVVPLGLIIF